MPLTPADLVPRSAALLAARLGGAVLARPFAVLARWRGGKPIHPKGASFAARLEVDGVATTGVAWLDERGSHDAAVRLSRSAGLPALLPDVHGLAVRLWLHDAPADVLLSGTGAGPVGRRLLRPAWRAGGSPWGSLLSYLTDRGTLVVALFPDPGGPLTREPAELVGQPRVLRLPFRVARSGGPWQDVGTLLVDLSAHRPDLAFDPVRHQPPGLRVPPLVAAFREPPYVAARRATGRPLR